MYEYFEQEQSLGEQSYLSDLLNDRSLNDYLDSLENPFEED